MVSNAHVKLATPAMVDVYEKIQSIAIDEDTSAIQQILWRDDQGPVEILNTGMTAFYTHARSEGVGDTADRIARHFKGKRNVWLMPPIDDEEYVSFTFIFLSGSESSVVNQLKSAIPVIEKFAEGKREEYRRG